jgi:hypothetical protein
MNRQIKWNEPSADRQSFFSEPTTPFDNQQIEKPLRITFHESALKGLSNSENEALAILKEFAGVKSPNLLALETGTAKFAEISNRLITDTPVQFSNLAASMVEHLGKDSSNHEQAFQDLIVARTHHELGQDILVTTSKWLLDNRELNFIEDTNPYLPSETVKIMGLLFRARSDFRYASIVELPRWLFYNRFIKHKLPAMGRYFRACFSSKVSPEDDIDILGQSISMRCVRAIQACDEIGRLFYINQNNNVRDETMYHFDYLTLLLSGALDAQARVAYRAYKINTLEANQKSKEYSAAFHKDKYKDKIMHFDPILAAFLKNIYFTDISFIITYMRNTIHGASLTTVSYDNKESYAQIPESDTEKIWSITEKYGSAVAWGLFKSPSMTFFEPYAFSQQLIGHTFKIVNMIASLTKVENLFAEGTQIPDLSDPPDDDTFVRERIALLV